MSLTNPHTSQDFQEFAVTVRKSLKMKPVDARGMKLPELFWPTELQLLPK